MGGYDSRPETYEHIGVVRELISQVIKGLLDRARDHDASKLEDPECPMFDIYTPRLKHSTYGSEEYRANLEDMGEALQHHYAHNRHHPEHHEHGIPGMNLIDLVEMFCDWMAATRRHDDGDIRKSLFIQQDRFGYSNELLTIFLNTVEWFEQQMPESDVRQSTLR